jgi:hypothetical protein
MGASLLVFKNKSDVPGCMNEEDIREVRVRAPARRMWLLTFTGIAIGRHPHPQMAHFALLSHDRLEPARRASMGRSRRKRPSFPLLIHNEWAKVDPLRARFNLLAGTSTRFWRQRLPHCHVNKGPSCTAHLHGKPLREHVRRSNEPFHSGLTHHWSSTSSEEEWPHIDGLKEAAFQRSRQARAAERCE